MQYYIIKPSRFLLIISIMLNLFLSVFTMLAGVNIWLKIVISGLSITAIYLSIRKFYLEKKTPKTIREHHGLWQIKTLNSWQDVIITKVTVFSDLLLSLSLKTKAKQRHLAIAFDSINPELFRQLRARLK